MPCSPPVDAYEIARTHSALTAVLAGFALAGLFLLVERVNEAEENEVRSQYRHAMLLLFGAFLTGVIASFLYSSLAGDEEHPVRAYLLWHFPSAIFAIHATILLTGINFVFSAFGVGEVLKLSRHLSYIVGVFIVFIIWNDLKISIECFDLSKPNSLLASVTIFGPVIAWLILMVIKHTGVRSFFQTKTFAAFIYSTTLASMFLAFVHNGISYLPEEEIGLTTLMIILLSLTVSLSVTWSFMIFPKEPVPLSASETG